MPEKYKRPSWDEYFIGIAQAVAKRATCDRGRNACLIVKDKRILSTGYVGAPVGLPHCDDVGHLLRKTINEDGSIKYNCIRTTHAEQNAIAQAARYGVPIEGATIYTKMVPCLDCVKMIINAGIKRIVCERDYHDSALSKQFLKEAGIELVIMKDEVVSYPKQGGKR